MSRGYLIYAIDEPYISMANTLKKSIEYHTKDKVTIISDNFPYEKTKPFEWNNSDLMNFQDINPVKTCNPTLLFPKGVKGKTIKISLKNQKSFIDSFAVSYRTKKFK